MWYVPHLDPENVAVVRTTFVRVRILFQIVLTS